MRLVSPRDRKPLRRRPGAGVTLRAVDQAYPVLGGIPLLVDDPASWCAIHHDAAVATLAAAGLLDDDALAAIAALAAEGRGLSQRPFADDFTDAEVHDTPPPRVAHGALHDLAEDAAFAGPLAWMTSQLGSPRAALELGPGAGGLTALLGERVRQEAWCVDVSLRALLLACARGGTRVHGAVADASALPFGAESFDLVVAQNVIDVVDAPAALVAEVARVLAPGGRFVLTTPEPALGTHDDRALENTLKRAGLHVVDAEDGILWPRVHGARHVELWVCRGVVAAKPGTSSSRTSSSRTSSSRTSSSRTSSTPRSRRKR